MSRICLICSICCLFTLPVSASEVTILYWGDRFARDFPHIEEGDSVEVGGAWQLAGMVETLRKAAPGTFVLAAGGDLAGTFAALETKGEAPAKVLGKIKPDAYGIGVVDFGFGVEALKKALKKGKVKAVLNNCFIEGEGQFLQPDLLLTKDKRKVAVTALVPKRLQEATPRDGIMDLSISDPTAAAQDFVKRARKNADLLVVLSQLGWEEDSVLARKVPGIDLIIEGHSRVAFDPPRKVGNTIIVASGPKGMHIGRLIFNASPDSSSATLLRSDLMPVKEGLMKPSLAVKRATISLEQRYNRESGSKAATLLTDWNIEPNAPCNLPQWAADAMKGISESAKLAVVCNLDFEQGVPRGDVTDRQISDIVPFSTPVLAFQIKGWELRRLLENQIAGRIPFLTWSGVNVEITDGKLSEISLSQAYQINDQSEFAVITYGLFWDRFKAETGLYPDERPIFIFPVTVQDLLIEKAKEQRVISTPLDDRWLDR